MQELFDVLNDKGEYTNKVELINKINNNYEDLTGKYGCWNYLVKYFEMTK